MNYFISEEEYAEISAKIDLSLEDFSISSNDDAENAVSPSASESELPDQQDPVSASILNFDSWKKYIEMRESVEKEQSLIQDHFSEALKDLRKVTNDKEVIVPVVLEKIEEIEEYPEDYARFEESQEKLESIQEIKQIEENNKKIFEAKEQEAENQKFEKQIMADEDFLSKLFENWMKKQIKLEQEEKKKVVVREQERVKDKEQRKVRIAQAEEKGMKYRIEQKEKVEKEKQDKARKAQEEAQRSGELQIMRSEDDFSLKYYTACKLLQESQSRSRESIQMTSEDSLSLQYRNTVPYSKRQVKFLTLFSPFQALSPLASPSTPTSITFPATPQAKPSPNPPSAQFKDLPCPAIISRVPAIKEDSNIEHPTLGNFLPYPIDSKAPVLEVKHEDLKSISGLSFFSNLQTLVLSLNKLVKVQNLPSSLKLLDLSQNLISGLPDLPCPLLEDLVLDLNQLTCIQGLKFCVNLRTLSLNSNKIREVAGLDQCRILSKLLLYRNKIKEIKKNAFAGNGYLMHIDLGRNKLARIDFLDGLVLVKSLILYQNSISQVSPLALPVLQELWLNGNSLKSLNFIKSCPLLENLHLEDNSICQVCSFECPILRNLNISFNNLQKFADIINCLHLNRSLLSFSFNDNPIVLIHPELLPMFNEIVVKALPFIQELNNTPRTSLVQSGLNKSSTCFKAFDLHSIDVLEQKSKRKNEICRFVSQQMKEFILQMPARVFNLSAEEVSASVSVRGIEWFWYEARKALHRETLAARVVQSWWKYKLFKRKRLVEEFRGFEDRVVKIQQNFRGWRVRKNYLKARFDVAKIVKIQAAFRGFALRKRVKLALSQVRTDDLDLAEFKEVNLDDVDLGYDFNNELIIPQNLDLAKFFNANPHPAEETKTPKLPPLKVTTQKQAVNRPASNRSLQSSTQSSLPPIVKNKAKEDLEKHLDEWGFSNPEVKEALQYRIMKKMQRKNHNKKYTADERLEKFRKSVKK